MIITINDYYDDCDGYSHYSAGHVNSGLLDLNSGGAQNLAKGSVCVVEVAGAGCQYLGLCENIISPTSCQLYSVIIIHLCITLIFQ